MLKGRKGNTLYFGLSALNVERLKKGEPMHFSLGPLHMPEYDVVIVYGETEQAIAAEMGVDFQDKNVGKSN